MSIKLKTRYRILELPAMAMKKASEEEGQKYEDLVERNFLQRSYDVCEVSIADEGLHVQIQHIRYGL